MKLRIRNVAKIEEADLELNGITVIAGNNNTGKSTIGKTVFSLFNSLVNIEEKLGKQKEDLICQMLIRKTEDAIMQSDEIFSSLRIQGSKARLYARQLILRDTEEEQNQILQEYLSMYGIIGRDIDRISDEMAKEIDRINHLSIEVLMKSAVTAYFSRIFYSEINSVYQPLRDAVIEADIGNRELSITFRDNKCTEIQQQIKIVNEAVYLDNPFVLDFLNNGISGLDEIEKNTVIKLRKSLEAVEEVVQLKFIEDKMQDVLKKINEISAGSLSLDESRSYYYKEQEINERLNINNLSAGLKTFVIIKTLLENGSLKQKDVLVLDEPEIHLHPDWQMCYAEIIILLQRTFELTIILTTHSAHFMEALRYFAEKYDRDEMCTYYLSEKSEYGYIIKNVTEDPTEIYSQLVDASILLDRLKFEMEEAKEENSPRIR